jgi:ABC-2 type transport system ATP-binding protein
VGSLVGAPALDMALTARQNLRLAARLTPALPKARVAEALEWVGLNPARGGPADDRPVRAFSTGMKQRLGLGLALLASPELLILDEPTTGMDPAGMREIRLLLSSLAEEGMTIFLSSHLLHEVEQICTRVAVLNRGRVVAEGPVSALISGQALGQPLVKVQVDQPRQAAALLASLPGACDIQPNGDSLTLRGASSQAVIRHLVANDMVPHEVINVRPDLESLFMELTAEG